MGRIRGSSGASQIYEKCIALVPYPLLYSSTLFAGWSSLVARQAHNLKAVGSNPTPATNFLALGFTSKGLFVGVFAFFRPFPRLAGFP